MAQLVAVEIWTDFAAAGGSRAAILTDATSLIEDRELNGRELLTVTLPLSSLAYPAVAERRVVLLRFSDGTVSEWRIRQVELRHDGGTQLASLLCDGAIAELRGPKLCEQVLTGGIVLTDFEILGLTPSQHLSQFILPASPSWVSLGTVDPTSRVDLRYERLRPLEALDQLADLLAAERQLRRQTTGTYLLDLLDQIGATAAVATIRLGRSLRSAARRTDDQDTITRWYAVGGSSEAGQATLADAVWVVRSVGTGFLTLGISHRGVEQQPVWKDGALNGLYVGKADGTGLQQITSSTKATARLDVASSAGFQVGDEVRIYRDASATRLPYLDDPATSVRRVGVLVADDVPAARNLAPNPRLDQTSTGSLPANVSAVGTPTTFAVDSAVAFHQIGSASLHVVADAAEEGAISDPITISPPDASPYYSAAFTLWIISGTVRCELVHSTMGVIPKETSEERAYSTQHGTWVTIEIVPGSAIRFEPGTVQLKVVSQDGPAEFYLDGWQFTNTAVNAPYYDGVPGVELWLRAAQQFTDQASSAPTVSYDLEALDLADAGYDLDQLTLGGTVRVVDPVIGLTEAQPAALRVLRLARDWRRRELVRLELGSLRGGLSDAARRRLARRGVDSAEEAAITLLSFLPFVDEVGNLWIDYVGSERVQAILFATSSTVQPTRSDALAGTVHAGNSDRFDTGVDVQQGQNIFVTAVPATQSGGGGVRGTTYRWSLKGPGKVPAITAVALRVNDADGTVQVRIEVNSLTQSVRTSTATAADPPWPTDANVEAGTVRTPTAGVVAFTDTGVGLGQVYRLRVAPYLNANGTGPGGATDHGTIVAASGRRRLATPPDVKAEPTQVGSTGKLDLTITDPDKRVTAVQYQLKTGTGDYGGTWLSAWDRSTGTPGTDATLTRGKDIALASGHQVSIKWSAVYTDLLGASQEIGGAHTFDADTIADVQGVAITFEATGQVVVSYVGDEDCAKAYVTVGLGGAPADPTAASNHGTITGRSGTIGTSVTASALQEAWVKVRAENAAGSLGPVYGPIKARMRLPVPVDVKAEPTQVGSTGKLDLTITDRDKRVTAVQYQLKTDAGGYGGTWLTTWDRSTGTPGTDATLTRGKDLALTAGHQVSIKWRVVYTDEAGASQEIADAHTFDADLTPDVRSAVITFRDNGGVTVAVALDEDCTEGRLTVTTDGTEPPLPGATDYAVSAPSAIVNTSAGVVPGGLARVKVRGRNTARTPEVWGAAIEVQQRAPAVGAPGEGIITAYVDQLGDHLLVAYTGSSGVGSVKIASSTTGYPADGTGTTVNGSSGLFDLGSGFAYDQLVYITITPYTGTNASGTQLVSYRLTGKLTWSPDLFYTSSGRLQSKALHDQGSVLPTTVPGSFSYAAGGPGSGEMWVRWAWTATTIYRPDGSTIAVPASTSLAQPPAPTLSSVAGGSLPARTRYVRLAYVRDGKIQRVGPEASIALAANTLLKVASPSSPGSSYSGWCAIVGAASGSGFYQISPFGNQPSTGTAFGTDWTEPTGGANLSVGPYATQHDDGITQLGLDPSTTYYWVPYWDLATSMVSLYAAGTSDTAAVSAEAFKDRRIGLALRVSGTALKATMSAVTPAASGSGSGTGGGKF